MKMNKHSKFWKIIQISKILPGLQIEFRFLCVDKVLLLVYIKT